MQRILFPENLTENARWWRAGARFTRATGAAVAIGVMAGVMMSGQGALALDRTRTTYLEKCGGCHGIEGQSGQTYIPTLRDRIGTLSCTPEGRAYLLTVPGVSMSLIRDDALMAQVMNFVLFDLGGHSAPPGTTPFTAEEVHAQRGHALSTTDLPAVRAQVWARAIACATNRR
ncbi:cystathionine beta-lyase [Gluconacetobacter tumulicola]|nr:cystathionine beta-lyase [Gluconacetobacter tumulicola]